LIRINAAERATRHDKVLQAERKERMMAGVTLSADEIKAAPPEVRRWLEQEMLRSIGVQVARPQPAAQALVGCNVEEARNVLTLVQGMLPVVNVFFELGREAASVAVHGMRAFSVGDIQRHVRLQAPNQVVECLDVLTAALRRARGDVAAAFYALDDQGHCLVAETTMRSILRLWQEIVAERGLQPAGDEQAAERPVGAALP
jgi:hypothetical protein